MRLVRRRQLHGEKSQPAVSLEHLTFILPHLSNHVRCGRRPVQRTYPKRASLRESALRIKTRSPTSTNTKTPNPIAWSALSILLQLGACLSCKMFNFQNQNTLLRSPMEPKSLQTVGLDRWFVNCLCRRVCGSQSCLLKKPIWRAPALRLTSQASPAVESTLWGNEQQ